jgi:beta-ketodecanoyl-[acyl-carrier-protein] synthase
MVNAAIAATGLYTPPHSISNDELVATFNAYVDRQNAEHADAITRGERVALQHSSSEFIEKASGIRSRFVVDKSGILDVSRMRPWIPERGNDELSVLAEMAVHAARNAIANWGKDPKRIGAVICAASNMQRAYPAMAIEIQRALGLGGFAFDMNVACSSATFGLKIASDLVTAGSADAVLMVNPEICSSHLNFCDRDSHFIFGDVATAAIVERAQDAAPGAFGILGCRLETDFSNNIRNNFGFLNRAAEKSVEPAPNLPSDAPLAVNDKLFVQQGRRVFKDVVPMVVAGILDHAATLGIDTKTLKRMWLHQANSAMNDMIGRKVLGRDPTRDENVMILDRFANTSSAGSIIAFHEHHQDFATNDIGLLCSFGAGYSLGTVFLQRLS